MHLNLSLNLSFPCMPSESTPDLWYSVTVGCFCSNKSGQVLDCKSNVPSVYTGLCRRSCIFCLSFKPLSGGIQVVTAYFLSVSPAGQGRLLLESSQRLLEWLRRLNNGIFRAFVSVLEASAL